MNPTFEGITERIIKRSRKSRADYVSRMKQAQEEGPARGVLSCSNMAHGIAACSPGDKASLTRASTPNIAIVSAYNDMLSAHHPFETYPAQIKRVAEEAGAVAQFAGGVPAMCDGVTQGQPGMDLSLFSRDVIALATAVALSHNMFDATVCLGICDKIVPGLLIGALSFGHMPVMFVPAGPMTSGLPNKEKARIREEFAAGKIGRDELLAAESASYHSPGTCTFYGTANSNQMLMEFMGLQLPGGSFVNPGTPLREQLTAEAIHTILENVRSESDTLTLAQMVDERAIINAMVGLLSTGGSTNHTLHLVAIANAAGVLIDWDDFSDLSKIVPLMARVYPNGLADVNHFHAAGGLGFVIKELLSAGLLHDEVTTILGKGLQRFCVEPHIGSKRIDWRAGTDKSLDDSILRPASRPFSEEGGLRVVQGNLGRAIVKTSAVDSKHRSITAAAKVFFSQTEFVEAFQRKELEKNFVAVLTGQGPSANGMPELHKLTPYLGVLQNQGYQVALITDGRMSGASGKVLAAIQVTPESSKGGALGKIRDGDIITIDAERGVMSADTGDELLESRPSQELDLSDSHSGLGRELFSAFRQRVGGAESGASIFDKG